LSPMLGPGDVVLLHGAGHHDLELVQLLLDPDADPHWVRDWRRRRASRIGRRVAEVLAFVEPGEEAVVLGSGHADALTYVATTGHGWSAGGRFAAADDAALAGRAGELGLAPLLGVPVPGPANSGATERALREATTHAAARGYRGVALDLRGVTTARDDLDRLTRNLAARLHADGLWLAVVAGVAALEHVRGAIAVADRIILDGGAAPAAGEPLPLHDLPPRAVLLQIPANAGKADILAASSLVGELDLRGVALAGGSVATAADLLSHRFQLRKRSS
jgi:hypothetical protein